MMVKRGRRIAGMNSIVRDIGGRWLVITIISGFFTTLVLCGMFYRGTPLTIIQGIVLGVPSIAIMIFFIGAMIALPQMETIGEFTFKLAQVGLSVVKFIPDGHSQFRGVRSKYRDVLRMKLPTETVHLHSPEEFISIAKEHNQDVVYGCLEQMPWEAMRVYTLSEDKTIAWSLIVRRESWWRRSV